MSIRRILIAGSTLGVAAILTMAPAALAADQKDLPPLGVVGVSPKVVKPGAEVFFDAYCESPKAVATSPVTPRVTLTPGASGGTLMTSTRVNKDAKPGAYTVTLTCDGKATGQKTSTIKGTFTVSGTSAKPEAAKQEAAKPSTKPTTQKAAPQVAQKPKGAPQTGGGGTAESDNTGLIVAGSAVALSGGGLGLWALRRRRTSTQH